MANTRRGTPQAGRALVARLRKPSRPFEDGRLGPARPIVVPRPAGFSCLWHWLASWWRSGSGWLRPAWLREVLPPAKAQFP
jgi:hypothetical protein